MNTDSEMSFQARALYDFESVGEGELGVKVGDVITVTDTSVGQGWWFGKAGDGREGVVPEAYLERLDTGAEERRASAATNSVTSWGDDWDSEEEHRSTIDSFYINSLLMPSLGMRILRILSLAIKNQRMSCLQAPPIHPCPQSRPVETLWCQDLRSLDPRHRHQSQDTTSSPPYHPSLASQIRSENI